MHGIKESTNGIKILIPIKFNATLNHIDIRVMTFGYEGSYVL